MTKAIVGFFFGLSVSAFAGTLADDIGDVVHRWQVAGSHAAEYAWECGVAERPKEWCMARVNFILSLGPKPTEL